MNKQKTFFGSAFLESDEYYKTEEKVEICYYKTIDFGKDQNDIKNCYGVEIVKKIYKDSNSNPEEENECIDFITDDEGEIDLFLAKLKNNTVTPIALNEIVEDYKYEK